MKVIEISCREVWRETSNFLEGSIGPELRARMEAHFAICKNCKAVLDGTNNVVKLIGDGQTLTCPPDLANAFSASSADQAAVGICIGMSALFMYIQSFHSPFSCFRQIST